MAIHDRAARASSGRGKTLVGSCCRLDAKWVQRNTPLMGRGPCSGTASWRDDHRGLAAEGVVAEPGGGAAVQLGVRRQMDDADPFGRGVVRIAWAHGGRRHVGCGAVCPRRHPRTRWVWGLPVSVDALQSVRTPMAYPCCGSQHGAQVPNSPVWLAGKAGIQRACAECGHDW
jgi:hypothetical protein